MARRLNQAWRALRMIRTSLNPEATKFVWLFEVRTKNADQILLLTSFVSKLGKSSVVGDYPAFLAKPSWIYCSERAISMYWEHVLIRLFLSVVTVHLRDSLDLWRCAVVDSILPVHWGSMSDCGALMLLLVCLLFSIAVIITVRNNKKYKFV